MNELLVAGRDFARPVTGGGVPDGADFEGIEVPRVLGRADSGVPGPTLIVVGGLHGNEPSGVLALQRIFETLEAAEHGLERGRLLGLAGNLKALRRKQRYLVHDLNRAWDPYEIARLRQTSDPLDGEDEELRDLDRQIETARLEADGKVYLVDLHSTSGPKLPFATLDDALPNRKLAFEFPVPVVLGLEEELSHTLTTWVASLGVITAGFESGQHDAPESVERAQAAIWISLAAAGLMGADRDEVRRARRQLETEAKGVPHVVEVRYRHPVASDDWFRMDPGWINFKSVQEGQVLAIDRQGPVAAPLDGMMLMPLYQKQGAEGFFIVQRVHFFWLKFSALVRHLHFERFLHLLPGVERDPERHNTFIVDRQTARWMARELFHLLGFRRLGPRGERYLTMARRSHDKPGRDKSGRDRPLWK